MKTISRFGWLAIVPLLAAASFAEPIRIEHTPPSFAVKGQSITLKAKVTGGEGAVESVTLFYALFRDAAPFRVTMNPSAMSLYIGTIEANMLSGVSSVSYYMEAQDEGGSIEETDWYELALRDPEAVTTPAPRTTTTPPPIVTPTGGYTSGGATAAPSSPNRDEGISATTIGIIAGGAVAVAGAAYLISDSGSDDGGGGGGDGSSGDPIDPVDAAGTYSGTATTCLSVTNGPQDCSSRGAQVVIDDRGVVFSDSLLPGQALTATLDGNEFSLVGSTDDGAGLTGTVIFNGTVVDRRVIGTISGTAITAANEDGDYSGSFSLSR